MFSLILLLLVHVNSVSPLWPICWSLCSSHVVCTTWKEWAGRPQTVQQVLLSSSHCSMKSNPTSLLPTIKTMAQMLFYINSDNETNKQPGGVCECDICLLFFTPSPFSAIYSPPLLFSCVYSLQSKFHYFREKDTTSVSSYRFAMVFPITLAFSRSRPLHCCEHSNMLKAKLIKEHDKQCM